jgi:uncharacterized protein (TIGR00255 family)
MIRSMTAYAQVETATPWGSLSCELKSVNHRFLEIGMRLADELRMLEPEFRERLQARLSRGKVDLNVRLRPAPGQGAELKLDAVLADRLRNVLDEAARHFPGVERGTLTELLPWPGLIVEAETDVTSLRQAALEMFERVLDEFIAAREREGEQMARMIAERLAAVEAMGAEVRGWMPEIREAQHKRLQARLAEVGVAAEPGRLEQEMVLALQKLDVEEELDRLSAHVVEGQRVMGLDEPVGRRLDFLMQEFNREANTLGSKSVDQRTSRAAMELKVLIEQMREQVQNME